MQTTYMSRLSDLVDPWSELAPKNTWSKSGNWVRQTHNVFNKMTKRFSISTGAQSPQEAKSLNNGCTTGLWKRRSWWQLVTKT